MFGHDPELPNGFQDADIEMRSFEETARQRDNKIKNSLSPKLTETISDLHSLLQFEDLDIPAMRREVLDTNLRWLQRNLKINNGDHWAVDCILHNIHRMLKGDLKKAWEFERTQCTIS